MCVWSENNGWPRRKGEARFEGRKKERRKDGRREGEKEGSVGEVQEEEATRK